MKNIFTLLIAFLLVSGSLSSQNIVCTDPLPKNAILEEFTGMYCPNCPDGHAIAASLLNDNPGRAFTIAIHQGSYAVPSGSAPDYRTPFGNPLASQAAITGYPMGTVNRHVFSGSVTGMGRGSWSGSAYTIMQQISPVNVGVISNYEAATRTLTIEVELYYTSDAPASSNFINLALIQDSIYGPQSGGGAGNNYRHMHMLRHFITGQWGDEVTTTTQGSLVNRTYSYVVPESYTNIPAIVEHMEVLAFVTESHQEIYTGYAVPAIGGTNLCIGALAVQDANIKAGSPDSTTVFGIEAISNLETGEAMEFYIQSSDAPADWVSSFIIDGVEYPGTAIVQLPEDSPKEITVNVNPGASAGFSTYVMHMKSVSFPSAPEKIVYIRVISGVTDLVVNATGGPEAAQFAHVYTDALAAAGNNTYALTNANVMVDIINADVWSEILTIWLNISWTFPALTDDQANAVMQFMDAGHSVFMGGQDIGWDIMSGDANANGTPVTRNFYTNYLNALFVDDGSSANNKLIAVPGDPIFGQVPQSSIVDVFGGYLYPDVINPGPGANAIFHYPVESKIAAIRYDGDNFRSIYFGIGLEMISNTAVTNQIVQLSHDWLIDELVSTSFDEAMSSLMTGQNYPNPATDYTWINVSAGGQGSLLEIYDINGRKMSDQLVGKSSLIRIDLNNYSPGIYLYFLSKDGQKSTPQKLIVVK
ncbi:MAG: Omp28-related outer membrane protein [Lentimicrobium sp.]|jgi:hypothetical protein|nr:Omp28-related outer membrane protein [Lentimicrobium sp.]